MRFYLPPTALAIALLAFVPASLAGGQEAARLGTATFEAAKTAISVPFTGPAPSATLYRLTPKHFYYEFAPAHLSRPGVHHVPVGSPLERFTLANRPKGSAVRLSFTLTRPANPSIRLDAAQHRFVVLPLGSEAPSVSRPRTVAPKPAPPRRVAPPRQGTQSTALRTLLYRPSIDASRTKVVVPYRGADPDYRAGVLQSDRRWVYLDLLDTTPQAGPRPFGSFNHPTYTRWVMSRRPNSSATRLSLRLARPGRMVVEVHPEYNQIWLLTPGQGRRQARLPDLPQLPETPQPMATPMLATPDPSYVMPEGVSTPTPLTPTPRWTPRPQPTPRVTLEQPVPVITPPPPSPTPRPVPTPKSTPKPRRVVQTHITGAYYDQARQALVLPFTGATPAYYSVQLSPSTLYLDFPKSVIDKPGTLLQAFTDHPLLQRWMAGDIPDSGLVRVTLNMVQRGEVLVAVDQARKQLLLIPQLLSGVEASTPSAQSPVNSVFGQAAFDRKLDAVILPYYGRTPLYAIEQVSSNYLYVDFLNAAVNPAGVQFETLEKHPLLTFWLLAKRQDTNMVRVTLNLPFGGHVRVLDDKANKRLLLVPQLGEADQSAPVAPATPTPAPPSGF